MAEETAAEKGPAAERGEVGAPSEAVRPKRFAAKELGEAPLLRIAYLHWPNGDDTEFFEKLITTARRVRIEVVPIKGEGLAKAPRPDLVLASLFADRPVFDAWRRANPDVPLVFWFGENTNFPCARHRSYDDYCLAQADLVLGYKRCHAGKANYARLPYWIVSRPQYIDERGLPLERRFAEAAAAAPAKTRFASMIARHDSDGVRGWMVRLLSHVGAVECPSVAYHNLPPGAARLGPGWKAKRDYTATCLFSICPENSLGDGYTTEKPFDALLAGAWPVYRGEKPCEPDVLRQECIIFADPADLPAALQRITECVARPPPTLRQAIREGGERAIDAMIDQALARLGPLVDRALGGAPSEAKASGAKASGAKVPEAAPSGAKASGAKVPEAAPSGAKASHT